MESAVNVAVVSSVTKEPRAGSSFVGCFVLAMVVLVLVVVGVRRGKKVDLILFRCW